MNSRDTAPTPNSTTNNVPKLSDLAYKTLLAHGLFSTENEFNLPVTNKEGLDITNIAGFQNIHIKSIQMLKSALMKEDLDTANDIFEQYPGLAVEVMDCLARLRSVRIKDVAFDPNNMITAVREGLVTHKQILETIDGQIFVWFKNEIDNEFRSTRKMHRNRLDIIRNGLLAPEQLATVDNHDKLGKLLGFCARNLSYALANDLITIADINILPTEIVIRLLQDGEKSGLDALAYRKNDKINFVDQIKEIRSSGLLGVILMNIENASLMLGAGLISIQEMNQLAENVLDMLLSDKGLILSQRKLITINQINELVDFRSNVFHFSDLLRNEKIFNALLNGMPVAEYIELFKLENNEHLDLVNKYQLVENDIEENSPQEPAAKRFKK